MKYDFTSVIDRRGKVALAVDAIGAGGFSVPAPKAGFDAIPMWVADMNFPACPSIPKAIAERVAHTTYGYFTPSDGYYNAIIRWRETHNGVRGLTKEHIGYENGVLGGVATALGVLCSRGDAVLLHAPTYIGFTHTLENNGYHIIHSELKKDEMGIYRMDFEDMEQKIVENNIHVMIFCSPHNPCGRVWEQWEVEQAMELCQKHGVHVISDEIWSDIIRPGFRHIPTQSVSAYAREHTVALYAPSKTFNLAGLVGSYHVIFNPRLKQRIDKEGSLCHYNSMNVLSMHALLGAYSKEGEQWVKELNQVLAENVDYAVDFIHQNFPEVQVSQPQGTYMLFLDCTQWCTNHGKTIDMLQKAGYDVGVAWQDGRAFHGKCHIRMNLALPLSRVQEAFRRLKAYVFVD